MMRHLMLIPLIVGVAGCDAGDSLKQAGLLRPQSNAIRRSVVKLEAEEIGRRLLGPAGVGYKYSKINKSPYTADKGLVTEIWLFKQPRKTSYPEICEVGYARISFTEIRDHPNWLGISGVKSSVGYIVDEPSAGCDGLSSVEVIDAGGAYRVKTALDILRLIRTRSDFLRDVQPQYRDLNISDLTYYTCPDDVPGLKKCYAITFRSSIHEQSRAVVSAFVELAEHDVGNVLPSDIKAMSVRYHSEFVECC